MHPHFTIARRTVLKTMTGAFAAALAFCAGPAAAQEYPNRVIKLTVPWAPGGTVDAVARLVAQKLTERLKQTVIVENKSGANGAIGTASVATSPADGYTFVVSNAETHTINPHVYKKLAYNPAADFVAVTPIVKVPFVLVARKNLPVASIADVVALAQAQPGKLTYASWGIGSVPQIGVLMLAQKAKLQLLHVPFNGGPPAFNAVLAEQVDLMIMPAGVADPMLKTGKVKVLAAMGMDRYEAMKNVPTLREAGYDIEMSSAVGLLAPAGTPQRIVAKIATEVAEVMKDPATRDVLRGLGTEPFVLQSPPDYTAYLDGELHRWGRTIKAAGIQID